MSRFAEIRNTYMYDSTDIPEEDGDIVCMIPIDTWETDDDNEAGKVVAMVVLSKSGDILVVWFDYSARMDDGVKEAINEAKEELRNTREQMKKEGYMEAVKND